MDVFSVFNILKLEIYSQILLQIKFPPYRKHIVSTLRTRTRYVESEVLTEAIMKGNIFWNLTPYTPRSPSTFRWNILSTSSVSKSEAVRFPACRFIFWLTLLLEDGSSIFRRNVGGRIPDYTVLHLRIHYSPLAG
jgi:hypothetical protein